jgi:hypothetical protein
MNLEEILLILSIEEADAGLLNGREPGATCGDLVELKCVAAKPAGEIVNNIKEARVRVPAVCGGTIQGRAKRASTLWHLRQWTEAETYRRPDNET